VPYSKANPISEARLILIVGLIQFINILDFMMIMPLGPDFATALGMPAEHIGIIGGSYTLAAFITGLFAALYLDCFDRKRAMLVALLGLAVATALGACAWNTESLLAARVLAGIFGGPLSSLSIAMIADFIPPARRGTAMGKVMGAFSLASVLGVPFGLELARLLGWQAPFLALGAICFAVWVLAWRNLPSESNTLETGPLAERFGRLIACCKNPAALSAFAYTGLAMMASFLIIPNISAHVQMNMNYPREQLGLLYLCGGVVSFFTTRIVGRWIDKSSATQVSIASTLLFMAVVILGFIFYHHAIPVLLLFIGFMVASSSRNIAAQTLSSKVPAANERGGFMSLLSACTHLCSAAGAFLSSIMLSHSVDDHLDGIEHVGMVSIAISCVVPFLFYYTESHIRRRAKATLAAQEVEASVVETLP